MNQKQNNIFYYLNKRWNVKMAKNSNQQLQFYVHFMWNWMNYYMQQIVEVKMWILLNKLVYNQNKTKKSERNSI